MRARGSAPRSWRSALAVCSIVLAAAVGGCSSGDASPPEASPSTTTTSPPKPEIHPPDARPADLQTRVDAASAQAIEYLVQHWDDVYPNAALATFDYLARAFGIEELAPARARMEELGPGDWEDEVLWRLADPERPVPELYPTIADASQAHTAAMVMALYCDRAGLLAGFTAALDDLREDGGYAATHAVLALVWADELGCEIEDRVGLGDRFRADLEAELETAQVTDLALEQSAMLSYLGRPDLVDESWIVEVLDAQNDDGGWSRAPGGSSDWHATMLGLWTLAATGASPTAAMTGPT